MTERKQISLQKDDTQAALDALARLEDILDETYIGSDFDTIRAALTAPDVNAEKYDALFGTIESQKQTHDALIRMNRELLEALKEAWSVVSSINYGKNHVIKRSDGEVLYGQTDEWCMWALKEVLPKMEQAIARAKQNVKYHRSHILEAAMNNEMPEEIYVFPDSDGDKDDFWAKPVAPEYDYGFKDQTRYIRADKAAPVGRIKGKIEKLLREFSTQKLSSEMDGDDLYSADFQGAYDIFIKKSRAYLKLQGGE